MDRQTLAELLDSGTEAWSLCRAALLQGARYQVDGDGDGIEANVLASIYWRRLSLVTSRRTGTVGFAEAVTQLRNAGTQPLRLGSVDTDESRRHYQLFLSDDLTQVIACLAIEPAPHRGPYRVERGDNDELRLYRGADLVDVDVEADSDLADIERWASGVAWVEDKTVIQRWDPDNRSRWNTLVGVAYRYVTYEFDVGDGPVTVWDELDSDNWPARHIEAVSGQYTVAAALAEVLTARDTDGAEALPAYERKYGVCPEAAYPPDVVAALTSIDGHEFARRWEAARGVLDTARG